MVSHLAIHSSFTQVTDAYLTAQFGQLLLSVCDAGYACLAVWFRLPVCQGGSNVSRLYNPLAAVLFLFHIRIKVLNIYFCPCFFTWRLIPVNESSVA